MESTIISSLELTKSLKNQTLKLIERSFGYDPGNSFEVDFHPLMNQANHKNCFVLLEENAVKAHIGALPLSLSLDGATHDVVFYGGICVDAASQGKGHFKKLWEFVRDQFPEQSLHFLWSEKTELYQKFGFHPAIAQYQYAQDETRKRVYTQVSLEELTAVEKRQLHKLYHNQSETRVHRDDAHWKKLEGITSSKLFVKRQGDKIVNYFFKDKGEDLNDIIHEYGSISELELREMIAHGTVWTPQNFANLESDVLFGALVKIGNQHSFKQFVHDYTRGYFQVEKTDDALVHFSFGENSLSMGHEEFLQGLFGPGMFEELKDIRPLSISGLDSI